MCGEKWGSRRGQLGMCDPTGTFQAQVLPAEQGLPLGAKLRRCQLGHPYSGHIPKVPLFGASADPLWEYVVVCVEKR